MNEQGMVGDFHTQFGLSVKANPHLTLVEYPISTLRFRMRLIGEEYVEVVEASHSMSTEALAKELADLLYVVYGTAVSLGFDLHEVFEEVHRSNMSKADENGQVQYREDGKVLKPDTYSKADVASVIFKS